MINVFPLCQILSLQLAVTLFLALVVGAIFFDVKNDQSGVQNRLLSLKQLFELN